MNEDRAVVAAEGVAPNGDVWTLQYRPEGDRGYRHHLALVVNGAERESGSGFDIPEVTEIGFGGGLKPGEGSFYLYGLVMSRIHIVRAESHDERDQSEVMTTAIREVTTIDGESLRTFVLVRPPVENVSALVGLDRDGRIVQRIPLVGPPEQS
ncbi:MAG: hypothetical protein WA966_12240 [Ornithinimicrobium sp.]